MSMPDGGLTGVVLARPEAVQVSNVTVALGGWDGIAYVLFLGLGVWFCGAVVTSLLIKRLSAVTLILVLAVAQVMLFGLFVRPWLIYVIPDSAVALLLAMLTERHGRGVTSE